MIANESDKTTSSGSSDDGKMEKGHKRRDRELFGSFHYHNLLRCIDMHAHHHGFAGLERLEERTDFSRLLNHFVPPPRFARLGLDSIDLATSRYLSDERYVALRSTGDGNCLFNSASIALVGDESLAIELRARTCVELLVNAERYERRHRDDGFELCASGVPDCCLELARVGAFCSVWAMPALASVIGRPLRSCYPPINGPDDELSRVLNVLFRPLHQPYLDDDQSDEEEEPIMIMWTSALLDEFGERGQGIWTPDHFVPLIKVGKVLAHFDHT